jgi:hypothetical protein
MSTFVSKWCFFNSFTKQMWYCSFTKNDNGKRLVFEFIQCTEILPRVKDFNQKLIKMINHIIEALYGIRHLILAYRC